MKGLTRIMTREFLGSTQGFTLIEMLVALTLFCLIVAAILGFTDVAINSQTTYSMQTDLSQGLSKASDAMVDQIRAAYSFSSAANTDVEFASYAKGTDELYTVHFWLAGADLYYTLKNSVGTAIINEVLATEISGLLFEYYDSAKTTPLGHPDEHLGEISMIKIQLTMTLDYGAQEPLSDTVTSFVSLRS
ncbi:MAG: hypothetical protein A2Y75_05480 [Candidatus Solincola sediminis]|uniref:Prepilin-type N-terminal cleavage/methylation domain-containing protein n=1 Tax=Candidatus Solincola sediminis TaxID=1797199 RepID=A0A1F2WFJ8_9ACTN|nr:MAG: hypothetical protein A2Y75_05480 [Candidatus Solincola sediminis]